MSQASHCAIALVPRKQRLPLEVAHKHRRASSALQTTTKGTGRACIQRLAASCQSYQGQRARVKEAGPDISGLDPALQQQWDHAANAHLGNIVIKPYSNRQVRWTCDQCPDGHLHSWSAPVYSRTTGNGCPQCSGYQVCKHNSLATKAPLVAAQWDYGANDGTPDDVVAQSSRLAHWHCKLCDCKWETVISARVSKNKTGCPQCREHKKTKKGTKHPTFAECNHPLLAEWDHKRNAAQGHFTDKTKLKSHKQIFWLCAKCPEGQEHSWSAMPNHRTGRGKSGCPFCAGRAACRCNSLQTLYPDTAAEWDYSKNQGQPSDHTASSTYLAWWSSPQRGSWKQTINARTRQVQQKSARLILCQQRQNSARQS